MGILKGTLTLGIGFCIHPCHIFVAGKLDVHLVSDVCAWFQKFDRLIGLDKLAFNDSDTDNHGPIGRGYRQAFYHWVEYICKLAYEKIS
jgi:endonuclease IV